MILSVQGPLEALLFAAGSEGLSIDELADILQLSVDETKSVCLELQKAYAERDGGIAVVELANHWHMVTRPEHSIYLRRMATTPTSTHLSTAALEVLAIVAYKQPASRLTIESIRGVQSDRAVQTLVHRQLIVEVGRMDAPGRPILYGTTALFLQTFGLKDIADLPPLPDEADPLTDLSLFELTPSLPRD